MSKRLLYSSSAVETKDIEMVARELKLIYNTFVYAMTQLEVKANIYSKLISRREKRKVELMDYWGTLPDDWAEYMGVKQFFEARLTPARCVAGIAPELFQKDKNRNSNMSQIMQALFSICKNGVSITAKSGCRYWGNFRFSMVKDYCIMFIDRTKPEDLNDLRTAIIQEEPRNYRAYKMTALRLGTNQPRILNHYTPVIRYLWKILGKPSQITGEKQGFLPTTTGIAFGDIYNGHSGFRVGPWTSSGPAYLIRLLKTLNEVEVGVLKGGYSVDTLEWYSPSVGDIRDSHLPGYTECDCRKSVNMYYTSGIPKKFYSIGPTMVNTKHLFSTEKLCTTWMPCYQEVFKLNIKAVHANIPASLLMMKRKSNKLAEIPLEEAFKAHVICNDMDSIYRDFINGPVGFPKYAFKNYLMYSCPDDDLGAWLTMLITGIKLECLCLGVACQGFYKWAIENDLVNGNEDILQIFNKIGGVAEKMALQKIPAYYLKILQSWEDNSNGFSSLKGWEQEPITYEL